MPAAAYEGPVRHAYVHVPFCRARCAYCDFASRAAGEAGDGDAAIARLFDEFVTAVAAEWERERAAHDVRRLHTLYLGGGTPSLLGPRRLERLLAHFRPWLTSRAEVTVEANPEDVGDDFAAWVGSTSGGARRGLRVSLGVQSFQAGLREVLGRTSAADPLAAAHRLACGGVRELGVDLIYGMHGQTADDLRRDLDAVRRLRPRHVSWYELTPPPRRPDADARAAGHRAVVRELERAGYRWYEVSSFALPGGRARHNVAYWHARPFLGLGAGAVSTVGARRWRNLPDAGRYVRAVLGGAAPPRRGEALAPDVRARERLLLASRCGAPVPLADVAGVIAGDALTRLAQAGLISLHDGTIAVTRKGRYVANEVCVRLFRA